MGVGVLELPAWILAHAGGAGDAALHSCLQALDTSNDARGGLHTADSVLMEDMLGPLPIQIQRHHHFCKAQRGPHEHYLVVLRLLQYVEKHIQHSPEAGHLQRDLGVMEERRLLNLHRFGFCVPTSCAGAAGESLATPILGALILWYTLIHGMNVFLHIGLPALGEGDLSVRRYDPTLSYMDHFGWENMFLKQAFDADALSATVPLNNLAVIEYPKCGGTWLGAMLTIAVENASFADTSSSEEQGQPIVLPRISRFLNITHGDHVHGHPFRLTASRLNHLFARHLRSRGSVFAAKKTVLLVRDPLDVLVSSFYERKYRGPLWNELPFYENSWALHGNVTLEDYVSKPEANGTLATYAAFLNNWVPAATRDPNVMVVNYESLLACPVHVLGRILNGFSGVGVSCAALRMAVASTTFERMKAASQHSGDSALVAADPANPDSAKFRRGKAHAAHRELSRQAYDLARQTLDKLLPQVREVFYTSARVCYVLGTEGAESRWWESYTGDLSC